MAFFILRVLIAALGLWLATEWVDGISVSTPMTLIFAALLLGIVNAFVRPIVVLLTLPAMLLTLGLFLLVVNAAMLGLVAAFLPGFSIAGFWDAFWAAIIVSVVSWLGSALFKKD
jgi:putative membrane protein